MAIQNWVGLGVYVGGLDVSGNAKAFAAPNVTVAELDTTSFNDEWTTTIGGLKSVEWSGDLMQDHAADKVDQLVGLSTLGTAVPISLLPAGKTGGGVAYAFNATQFAYTPLESTAGELAMAKVSGNGTGAAVRGTLMNAPGTPITTTGAGATARQLGAIPAGSKMYGALHVIAASGTSPTMDVVVQSDDSGAMSSPTSRMVFSQATGITSEWLPLEGPITDDYWRASITIGGTTPSFNYVLVLGIAAN
jgi:hypothetical protein